VTGFSIVLPARMEVVIVFISGGLLRGGWGEVTPA